MKLRDILLNEIKYLDTPVKGAVFNSNNKDWYITNVTTKNVEASTFKQQGRDTIVLSPQSKKFDLGNLEMKIALDAISLYKNEVPNVYDQKEWSEYLKLQRQAAKDAKAAERLAKKIMTKRQYEKELKDAVESMQDDGQYIGSSEVFDIAQGMALDHKISAYAKHHYGNDWMQRLQWDLEGFLG